MQNPIKYDLEKLAAAIRQIPKRVAVVAENFSKQRFREQGWKDTTFIPWSQRKREKYKDKGRAVLVKSGRLRRSIKARAQGFNIIISSDVPYAEAHNEGCESEVSETIRPHTRKSHQRKSYTRKDGRNIESTQVKDHEVGGYTRKRKIGLPQRRFIGPSNALDKEVISAIEQSINTAIKN